MFTARNEARDCLSRFQQKVDDAHNQLNFAINNDVSAGSIQLLKEWLGIAKRQLFASQQLANIDGCGGPDVYDISSEDEESGKWNGEREESVCYIATEWKKSS